MLMLFFSRVRSGHKQKRLELQGEFFRKAEELETAFAEQLATKAVAVSAACSQTMPPPFC